jgi:signal transduction histidine kinase/ligand-binding sensor domain-containing protein
VAQPLRQTKQMAEVEDGNSLLPRFRRFLLLCCWAAIVLWLGPLAGELRSETNVGKQYLVNTWRSEQGLSQNTVTGIAQTPEGYLWLSTLDGLARFDGVRFKIFKAGNTPALGSGRIRFLFPGPRGELWLATQEGGVIQYKDGRFNPLDLPEAPGLRSAAIQVAEDNAGRLWISTEDGKVQRLAHGRYFTVSDTWSPAGRTGFQVRVDKDGRPWAFNNSALFQVKDEQLVPVLRGKPNEFAVHCPSRSGGWWVSLEGQVRLWRDGQWVATVPGPTNAPSALRGGLEDRNGHLWLATWGSGLFRCDTNGGLLPFTKPDGLGSDYVRTLCEDNEGNLWVGTEGGGLNRLRSPLFTTYGLAPGLSWEWITSVSSGPDGKLWVGTDGYGLNLLQGDMIRPVSEEAEGSPLHVMAALADRQGQVWLGTRAGGLFQWAGGHLNRLSGFTPNGLIARSLFEDSKGAIWVGWRHTDCLTKIERVTVTNLALPKAYGLLDVRVIAEDASGGLWLGTDGSGLFHYQEGRFTRFTRENGLGSDFIWALQPEPEGALWVGTYGGGLTRLKGGRAVTCTTLQGLPDDVICYIADDGRGQYWMSSHQGVFRVSKRELNQFADGVAGTVHCVVYGKADGLPTLECRGGYQPAGCRGRDGRLWFPTIAGLVAIDPAEATTNTLAPAVYIEAIVIDGEILNPADWQGESWGRRNERLSRFTPAHGGRLEIAPGKQRFEFHYTGLNLGAPETLRFRHKLEGVDAEWVETGSQRGASYNQLRRGTYTFRVQTCNQEGLWNGAGAALTFSVLPCFYQTWWFIGLFLLTFGGAVAWVVGHLVRARQQRHLKLVQRLHAAERERTRIARDIHDDLGSSLTEIGLLGALAVRDTTPPDEARKQVARMMARAEELSRKLDETVWAVNPKNDSLRHLASYLCNLAKEFFEPTAIRCRFDVASDLPDAPLTTEVRHNVLLAAKEALNNVAQHSGATELWLRMAAANGVFTLEVADNGQGFAAQARAEAGNGLRNMKARMEEIGGQFEMRTMPGQGTTVSLRLPLPAPEAVGSSPTPRPKTK